jgi:hypothetical protein
MDGAFEPVGYRPVRTFRIENLPAQNFNRVYQSSAGPAAAVVSTMRHDFADSTVSGALLELATEFRDGTIVNTRSATMTDLLDVPPGMELHVHRGASGPEELLRHHERHCEPHKIREPVYRSPEELEDRLNAMHSRWLAHQEQRRLLRPRDAAPYGPTVRLALRGIRTFLDPFADQFAFPRLALALLAGFAVPVIAIAALSVSSPFAALGAAFGEERALLAAMAPLLLLASASVGWILDQKGMLWGLLFTWLCGRWFLPEAADALVLAGWLGTLLGCALISGFATSLRNRRRSVL